MLETCHLLYNKPQYNSFIDLTAGVVDLFAEGGDEGGGREDKEGERVRGMFTKVSNPFLKQLNMYIKQHI